MKYPWKVALRRYIIHVSRGAFSLDHKSQKLTSLGSSSSRHNGDLDAVTMSSWRPRPTPLNWNPVSYSYPPSSSSSFPFSSSILRCYFATSLSLFYIYVHLSLSITHPESKFQLHISSANSLEFLGSIENLEIQYSYTGYCLS